MSEIYIFACQHRVPHDWRPPFTPDAIEGRKVRLIRLPCSAKLGTIHMLRPFEEGIDGVIVMACLQDDCRSLEGSRLAKIRVREANMVLAEVGLGNSRIMIKQEKGSEQALYFSAIDELSREIERLGSNPIKGNNRK